MSERGELLVERFAAANSAFLQELAPLPDAQWRTVCAGEGWTVGTLARHVAMGTETILRHIHDFLADPPPPPETVASVNERNASDAARVADCSKAETLAHLGDSGAAAIALVRGLTNEALDRRGVLAVGFPERDVAWLAGFLVRHLDEHRASIRGVLAEPRLGMSGAAAP